MISVIRCKRPRARCNRWAGCLVALALLAGGATAHAQRAPSQAVPLPERAATVAPGAQSAEGLPSAVWHLVVDGEQAAWDAPSLPADSLRAAARSAVADLQREGFYFARADSAAIDSAASGNSRAAPVVRLYVSRGPKVRVGSVQIDGAEALGEDVLRRLIGTAPGQVFDPQRLEADLAAVLARYEADGYPLAQIRVDEVALQPGDPPTLGLTLAIDEGGALWLRRVAPEGGARTSAAFAARAAGLRPGQPLTAYDPDAIRERLEATGLYRRVGTPELRVGAGGATTMAIPLEEEPPGAFDLVLGYLPPEGSRGGRVVGQGHLALSNLFGGGRRLSLRLDRSAGQVSTVHAQAADPYVMGWPLRLELGFDGRQQDSTFNKQAYRVAAGYELAPGVEVVGTLSREATRPGTRGAALQRTAQQVARADAWFAGLGLRARRLDNRWNPRRGFLLETTLERGRKERAARVVTAEGDTTARGGTLRQERLEATGRLFLPAWARQVVALGADADVLLSDVYDDSDLFRLGGATSLRGYDEERFRGNVALRVLAEYRYLLDRRSFAYLFVDLGYVETPALAPGAERARGWYPGYGIGLQFDTRLGLVGTTYALNTEDGPVDGRVHIGLSVGL